MTKHKLSWINWRVQVAKNSIHNAQEWIDQSLDCLGCDRNESLQWAIGEVDNSRNALKEVSDKLKLEIESIYTND